MKPKKSLPKGRRLASNKRGILIKGKWKPVELDPSLFADQAMGGLVCFEELADYSLVDSDRALIATEKLEKSAEEKMKKKKKRKASELEAQEEEEEEEVAEVDGETLEEALEEGDDVEQEELEGDDGKLTEPPAKKKRKRQKKKKKKKPADEATATASAEGAGLEETGPANQSGSEEQDGKDQETAGESLGQETEGDEKSSKTEKKKKKRRKKKKPEVTTQTAATTDAQTSAASQEDKVSTPASQSKKKKVKNWTSAALGGSSAGQAADVSAWKDLFVPEPVLRALSKLGFSAPTPIQALVLPPAIRDHMDILGAAETGSGKTLSFGIPLIHNILEWKSASESWKLSQAAGSSDTDTTPQEGGAVTPATGDADAAAAGEEAEERESLESSATEKGPPEASEHTPSVTVTEPDAESKEDGGVEGEEDAESKEDGGVEGEEDVEENNLSQDDEEEEEEGVEEDEDEPGAQSEGSDGDSEDEGDDDDDERGCVQITETDVDRSDVQGSDKQPLLALILTPTRELAVQVKHHVDAIAQFTGIRTALIVGGMALQKQQRVLSRRPEIVIATPGRLWDLIKEGHPHLQNLRHVRSLVIDEADRMVERGHFAELENLLEMLSTSQFNPKRQAFVFSATLTMVHSLPQRVQQKKGKKFEATSKLDLLMQRVGIKDKPKVIDLTRKEATVETLTETRIHCEKEEKDFYLYYFLSQYPGRTMVFANSIDCIKRLNSLLVILDHTPLPLHANMHQKQRLKNLERFAERDNCVLLTTDVAARGLDIPNVQHVIHYQVPRTSETYVHRSGRTARATKQGLSLLLIGPDDLMNYKKIYRTLGKDEDLPMFPVQTKCMAAIKERVKLAWQIEKIEYHNSKQKQHNSWFRQAAEAMEIDLDDDVLISPGHGKEDDVQQQKMVKGMKKHLKHLLSQPIFRNDMKTKYPTQMGKLQLPELPLASVETALTSVARHKDKKQWRHKKPKKN